MIVDFMLIGAQKCGTTSLAQQLATHPQICFSNPKEPEYFNTVSDWRSEIERYHAMFQPEQGQICGEASTLYTSLPAFRGTSERIYEYSPSMKLIYMMRNPVERIISNFTHDLVRSEIQGSPETAVFTDPGYVDRSRYAVQIRPYLESFGREQVLLLIFEEYVQDAAPVLDKIAEFIGVDRGLFASEQALHAHKSVGEVYLKHAALRSLVRTSAFENLRSYVPVSIRQPLRRALGRQMDEKPHFSLALRRDLWRFLEDDVRAIEELMGRRLDLWRDEEWTT